jgi:biopolymer transport protein TolQ
LFFSVVSWTIIGYKQYTLSRAASESEAFLKAFKAGGKLEELVKTARTLSLSPLANIFNAVYAERDHAGREELRRLVRRYETLETEKLYSRLTFLATTGSTSPFIGLLGTVWGIMNAFRGIGATSSTSLSAVASGIAEALITTAAGLLAAIPAVVAYNYCLSRVRKLSIEMEDFSEELLDALSKPPR